MPANSKELNGEEFFNQSSLCSTCVFGVRQVITEFDQEFPTQKILIFFCHSKAINGGGGRPGVVRDLVHECEPYKGRIGVLIT